MGFSNQTIIADAAMMQPVCHWTVLSLVTWWVSFDGHAVAKQDCGPSQTRRIVFLSNTRPPLCRVHTTVSNIVVFVAGDPVKVAPSQGAVPCYMHTVACSLPGTNITRRVQFFVNSVLEPILPASYISQRPQAQPEANRAAANTVAMQHKPSSNMNMQ